MSCKNLDVISISAKGCGIGIFRKRVVKSTYEKVVDPVIDLPCYKDEILFICRHENRNVLLFNNYDAIKKSYKISFQCI